MRRHKLKFYFIKLKNKNLTYCSHPIVFRTQLQFAKLVKVTSIVII